MQAGLHALNWSLTRLGIGLGVIVGLVVLAYMMLVLVVIVGQAGSALLGQ
jgi:hypothetical protein